MLEIEKRGNNTGVGGLPIFLCWLVPQKSTANGAQPGQSQEPGTPSLFPTWVAGEEASAKFPLLNFQVHPQVAGSKVEQVGHPWAFPYRMLGFRQQHAAIPVGRLCVSYLILLIIYVRHVVCLFMIQS